MRGRPKSAEQHAEANRGLDASALESALGYRLRMLEQVVMRNFASHLEPFEITPTLFSILVLIRDNPGCRQTDLSVTLGMHQPNLVERVGRLVERRLVARLEDASDRRANALRLTPAGRDLMTEIAAAHEAHIADVADLLGADRYQRLTELMSLPLPSPLD